MSTTTEPQEAARTTGPTGKSTPDLSRVPRVPQRPDPEPQPWLTDEERAKIHFVARGSGKPRRVGVVLELDLNPDQADWLRKQCERTGQDYISFVLGLIEHARTSKPMNTNEHINRSGG
jgi:hypothetical protein